MNYALVPAAAVGLEVRPERGAALGDAGLAIMRAIEEQDRPGTSARLAQLQALGALGLGEPLVNESVLGTRFTGRAVETCEVAGRPAIVPEITGRAWITGMGSRLLAADDPFPAGFAL